MSTVQVIFEGQDKNFTANVQKIQKEMDGFSKKLKEAGVSSAAYNQAIAKQNQTNVSAIQSVKNFASANAALIGTITAVAAGAVKSYQAFQQYAGAVRDVALASGSSAEEASRLLQVLDDFEISAQDVMAATKAMTKNGLKPSIDTLAKLSDEYVKINDPMERNEFILKNLGKAGLQWANALSQGGDALQAMGDEVNKSLVLTDEQIKKAEQARLAVDTLSDAWEGAKVAVGGAIGDLIVLNQQMTDYQDMTGKAAQKQGVLTEEFKAFQAQMKQGAAATEFWTARMEDAVQPTEDLAAAQAELEASSQKYMGVLKNISSETEQFTEKNAELLEKLEDLRKEQEGTKEGSDKYKELAEKIGETEEAVISLADEHAQASKQIMFDLISQQAAADGFKNISVEALARIGEQWGVLAEGSGSATVAMISQAEAWSRALSGVPGEIQSIAEMWAGLAKLSETGITLTAQVVSQATNGAMGGQNVMTQCFTGDTLVTMADLTSKPIKDIQIGDAVLSHDIAKGQNLITTVTETFEHPASDGGRLLLINGYLKVTPEHLLWNGREYKAAGTFTIGDLLVNLDGSFMRVASVREIIKSEPVYNIHVDNDVHNYYAGGVLVHNAKEGGLWTGGMVGSFAGGGKAGGWGIVGDRPGGGFIPGVSELIYGNARVFNSRQSAQMLKSGRFGKVPGFAVGGNLSGGAKKPWGSSLGGGNNGGDEDGSLSAMSNVPEMQAISEQVSNVVAQQVAAQVNITMQAYMQTFVQSIDSGFAELGAIMRDANPRAVGKYAAAAFVQTQV